MQRKPLLAGNWKMFTNLAQATELAKAVAASSKNASDRDVMIAPPYVYLAAVNEALKGSNIILAAQNICWDEQGAFTGEISPVMLKEVGCGMAIIGHSERRHVFGETDTLINQRIQGALKFGLIPVFCIGEKIEEREAGNTFKVLEGQVRNGLKDIAVSDPNNMVIAYEPVWAIGTGKTATEEQAQEAHSFVRKLITDMYEKTVADQIRILYGGSVNPGNVDTLMRQDDIDGALVGGASLKADSFDRIINFQK